MSKRLVFDDAPVRVYWEITRACSLACVHCRAEAAPHADPAELDTKQGLRLLAQLAAAGPPAPHVVLTGGDPLERADLFELIAAGRSLGLGMSVSPSATPRLTDDAIVRLKNAGVEAISLSLDGSTRERHDALRRVPGCFDRTLAAAHKAAAIGLAFQVNTLVSRETLDDLPAIEALVRALPANRWSLFFLVTVGRGTVLQAIDAHETETLLAWLAERARVPGMVITTTEAPHFRRLSPVSRHGAGIRDGNGILFIGHDGSVSPSGFLPLSAGNAKLENPIRLYRDSLLFRSLRNADGFHGRCGRCEYRFLCGGSRARAYAATGDTLAEDPLCVYEPKRAVNERGPAETRR